MKQEQEKITVQRTYFEIIKRKRQEVFSDEDTKVRVGTFSGVPVANISFRASITKNLGDFNSASVSVEVQLPCYVEELDEAASYASDKVDEYLAPSLDELVDILRAKGMVK